jgi:ribosomal subunit interface protein
VDIVIKGRNVTVPDRYRAHILEKLQKVVRYDSKTLEIRVELSHERNPRQADHCDRVEITVIARGPVIRAEACTADFYSALDLALAKLDSHLRRIADRRRVHRGQHAPTSVARATAPLVAPSLADLDSAVDLESAVAEVEPASDNEYHPGRIVRMKEHPDEPMTVEDALFQMELVGHDFFLFHDKDSGRPSVVYRRRGYDYGVITLAAQL